MRRARVPSYTTVYMMGIIMLVIVALVVGLWIALSMQSPKTRFAYPAIPTVQPTSSTTSTTFVSSTTTIVSTSAPVSTTFVPTTTPFPIGIVCPLNVSVELGSSLEPAFTGGFAVGTGGCSTPVVQWEDDSIEFLSKKSEEEEEKIRWAPPSVAAVVEARVMGMHVSPTLMTGMEQDAHGMLDMHFNGNIQARTRRGGTNQKGKNLKRFSTAAAEKRNLRSPSFNNSNIAIVGTPLSLENTGANPPDSTASLNDEYIVMGTNSADGALIIVSDKNTTLVASFLMNTLGTGNCSTSTRGDPQVLWDHDAQRWVLLELGVDGTDVLCVYLSDDNNPLGNYSAFQYDFAPHFPDFPKLGLWPRAYLLTFNKAPLSPSDDPKNMCVIDRIHMLNFVPNVNQTAPRILCAASLFGRLPAFDFQAWTPLSAVGGPMPPMETESANALGAGAVFFRPFDDELQSGAHTPTVDFIQVEHWSNINWTAATVSIQRYSVPIADFDSSFDGCPSSDECIKTPTSQQLDPLREVFSAAKYRRRGDGTESVVSAFVSHANGTDVARVRWFELRWSTPSMLQPKSWRLYQEGTLPFDDGVDRWMPSIDMDLNGTVLLGYSASSASLYPSLYATSRLNNDPLGKMRTPLNVASGAAGSVISSKRWGDYSSVSMDGTRNFYLTGQISDTTYPWIVKLAKIRVLGETISRVWTAYDTCGGSAICTQWITTE